MSLQLIQNLFPAAFAIAMLGAIESLLSAVVADGMGQTKHDPDVELMALGIGNMMCPFFGGIAATGAIARTATNIRFGAKSPLSATIHGIFTLGVLLAFAPYVSYLPMAALSALLLLIAYNMAEIKHFKHIIQVAPKSDVIVLLLCFFLTVIFDMVIGVTTGILLAALLFMKRMSTVTSTQILEPKHHEQPYQVPNDVLLYDINGPLFFGAAETAVEAINNIRDQVKTVFLLMEDVPVMDVTGLVALESAIGDLIRHKRKVYLVGVKPQPKKLMLKSAALASAKNLFFCATVKDAVLHHQGPVRPVIGH
jgi:SulP family sulfate permease